MKGIFTTLLLGGVVAQVGLTGTSGDPAPAQDQDGAPAVAAYDRIVPPGGSTPPPGMISPRADIAVDVETGIRHLDKSVRQLPGYTVKMAEKVEKHGIAALAYEDPELKRMGNEIGNEIGVGIRHFASALARDLVTTSKEAGSR